jgi:DNA-binding protein H-NS
LVANIQELKETVTNLTLETTRNINRLAEEAAQERQQAALDRQEFRNSINQILNYLRDRNGGSPPPQQ